MDFSIYDGTSSAVGHITSHEKIWAICRPLFGKVTVYVAYLKKSMKTQYRVAQQSLQCYLKGVNYTVLMVDLDEDTRVQKHCARNKEVFFKKHCGAAAYLVDTDWMLVLDADTGVVNPNHCVEEWIDDRVDIIFYERFFNWEIASGNYLVRNTEFGISFLKSWGEYEFAQPLNWNGADNGALQILILKTVMPDAWHEAENCDEVWHNSTGYETYLKYVSCVKQMLGATRLWPGKVRIYRRAHGWVRDGFSRMTNFMLHGWKLQNVGDEGWESPFKSNLNPSNCGVGLEGWDWITQKHVNTSVIRKELAAFERQSGNTYPVEARPLMYISMPDIGDCYPFCDNKTWEISDMN
ncbi:hypothetical protein KIN20_021829 [Parelaphostrongylus tenuis]|uniref:Uncharacterized protein n=1 Tax=Parelaphostrongylus tenuis TaxID=148309 RepID=A0AAD5NB46_PARTN|nr:hypothetical protein KIN20_021829 [Parelaphostrongylus tenuis]